MTEGADNLPSDARPAPVLDQEGARRFLSQMFDQWLNPEIERRAREGQLQLPLNLIMAQILFPAEGPTIIRLNEEVRGFAWTRISRPVEKDEAVLASDLEGLEAFELDPLDLDCGHVTLFRIEGRWFSTFNFQSQRGRALNLLAKAGEFLEAAEEARRRGHASVAVDTLFSACELISKAELVVTRQTDVGTGTHKSVAFKINAWRKLGNIEGAFVDIFNRLGQLRYPYRYSAGATEEMPVSEDDLTLTKEVLESLRSRIAPKVSSGD